MERIRLNIIPKGLMPVCHASQYDDGRVIRLDLMDDLQGYSLTDEEIELDVRKPDGHIVTASVDVVAGNTYVDIVTTKQMCAVEGENICELKISKDGAEIYSPNFKMMVKKSVTEGGDPSESFVYNLHTQIADGVAEEVATQYDSANVIFDNAPTSGHGVGYTVTSEGIKTAIDNAFDYDNTASGSLVHIEDGADNIPVKSLVSEIVAVQSGSGTPSPSNPRAISGFDSGIITRCGKNLYNTNNQTTTSINTYCPMYLPTNTDITFSTNIVQTGLYAQYYDNGNWVAITQKYNTRTLTFNTGNHNYIRLMTYNEGTQATEFQAEFGTTETTYEPYIDNTYTFAFGQTVFGGHFDNKGNLVVTHGIDTSTGDISEGWFDASTGGIIRFAKIKSDMQSSASRLELPCNIAGFSMGNENNIIFGVTIGGSNLIYYYPPDTVTDLASLYTFLSNNNLKVVYPLANPITLTITSQDIPTLLGENNIFSNTGDVEVNYYTSKSNDILEFIDSEIGKKNGTNIPIEENSQDSIKDYIDNEVSTITTSLSGKADKTEDATITVESGYTLISSSCGKTDRLVHLNFNVEKTGGFATGWQAIGTTDFKPNTLAYCPLWNVTNGVANGEVRIDTDGTINFYVVTGGELRLNANIGYVTS